MIDNRALLHRLFDEGKIELERAAFLDTSPAPLPGNLPFDRIEGMLLGLAIGDALGNTSESQLPSQRRQHYGEIRDYLPNEHAEDRRVGCPSDDTQMAFWTLEQLLEDDGLVPDRLAQRFCREHIFGIGRTVRAFLGRYKEKGLPWDQAGVSSAGNGALMRIAPVLLPHFRQPSPALWADVALAAMLTHNDLASTAASVSFIHLLWQALSLHEPPAQGWWLDTFGRVSEPLEGKSVYHPRDGRTVGYCGPMSGYVALHVGEALEADLSVVDACDIWHSGAYLLETVPGVLYILEKHGHNPEEALTRAVNDTWDNDSVAAIVGAAVGALHGRRGLPHRWVQNLTGRTGPADDGHVQALISEAHGRFWFD